MPESIPTPPIPGETPAEGPTSGTVLGKTREEWFAMKRESMGEEWVEANRSLLESSWRHMVRTFGD